MDRRPLRPRANWAVTPDGFGYSERLGSGDVRNNGAQLDDEPKAVIHLPNGRRHEVPHPPRSRMGFRT